MVFCRYCNRTYSRWFYFAPVKGRIFKKYPPFEWRRAQSDTAVGNKIRWKRTIWNAHWQSFTQRTIENFIKVLLHEMSSMRQPTNNRKSRASECKESLLSICWVQPRFMKIILLRKLSSAAPCGHRLRWRYQNSGGGYSVASYILSFLRKERLGEKGGAFLNGKEGRVGFRKMPFLMVKKVSVPR